MTSYDTRIVKPVSRGNSTALYLSALYLSASLASGAGRMATHCPFYTPPKSTIISIFELLSEISAPATGLLCLNTFYTNISVLESICIIDFCTALIQLQSVHRKC